MGIVKPSWELLNKVCIYVCMYVICLYENSLQIPDVVSVNFNSKKVYEDEIFYITILYITNM